jgi:hypothetical protein
MQQEKLKRKRVPHNFWPDIQARYNSTYSKNSSINSLRQKACRNDLQVLEVIAEVIEEKQQKALIDAQRVEAKLLSANMI